MSADVGGLSDAKAPGLDVARPFEQRRIVEALRSQLKMLLAVGLLALFGGAVVARFAVTLDYEAQSVVQVDARGTVATLPWVESDRVLDTARVLSHEDEPVAALRKRIEARPLGTTRIGITAHAETGEQAIALSDAVSAAFIAEVLQQGAQQRARSEAQRKSELTAARSDYERASSELARALHTEGVGDIEATLSQARTRLSAIEVEIAAALARATAAEAHDEALRGAGPDPKGVKASPQALAEAQRALSTLLAQHDASHPEVQALRDRIRRLQTRGSASAGVAKGKGAEARAEMAKATELEREAALQRELIATFSAAAQRVAPLLSARDRARERLAEYERAPSVQDETEAARVHARASVVDVSNRGARALAALLAPLLALLLTMAMIIANEVRDFRVSATTELAHWLQAPVIGRSEWPGRPDRLELLIDELAESALDAPGTTLVLPLTDLERPLALTIASQLNGRAQRHFRTATGARVTIAQAWEGEASGPGVKRAAEIADRVLWVVSADTYAGADVRRRRDAILRRQGVAALLLDAESHGVSARIGDASTFWSARSDADEAAQSVPPPRVPLH